MPLKAFAHARVLYAVQGFRAHALYISFCWVDKVYNFCARNVKTDVKRFVY